MTQDKASVCANRISTKHVILALAGALWAVPVAADTWTIQSWPARPRGGPGTFQATWANRVAPDPGEGVASFYSDRETASGERLRPDDAAIPEAQDRPDARWLAATRAQAY